jgi:NAD(P)H-hydrate repair Nnr-like enzyme with NAD(P)H-hydrate epimerase domain
VVEDDPSNIAAHYQLLLVPEEAVSVVHSANNGGDGFEAAFRIRSPLPNVFVWLI